MQFTKMHGAGNDYVYVDCFQQPLPKDAAGLARRMSDRHKGVGADGLILICPSDRADVRMRMFNADGSEAEMCGNGIRCVAKYVYDHDLCRRPTLQVETGAGILTLQVEATRDKVQRVRVDMGPPILSGPDIPTTFPAGKVVDEPLEIAGRTFAVTCVSMGNPHCIIFVDRADDALVHGIGPQIECAPQFPARVNVEFVELISRSELRQRTWERGSGETQACGTGASAVCVAGVLSGRTDRRVVIHLLGGDLLLQWNEEDNHVYMTGPAEEVFTGHWRNDC
jgi:diaminopimelate epimerase